MPGVALFDRNIILQSLLIWRRIPFHKRIEHCISRYALTFSSSKHISICSYSLYGVLLFRSDPEQIFDHEGNIWSNQTLKTLPQFSILWPTFPSFTDATFLTKSTPDVRLTYMYSLRQRIEPKEVPVDEFPLSSLDHVNDIFPLSYLCVSHIDSEPSFPRQVWNAWQ